MIFLEKRAHKTGAQTCLARLIGHHLVTEKRPVLVTSEEGWLTERTRSVGVETVVVDFPSARSLAARAFGTQRFAKSLKGVLQRPGQLVVGNDLQESLLSLALAKELGSKSVLFLRSSGMNRRDYEKHGCDDHALIIGVGDEIRARAQGFATGAVELIYDGIASDERYPPKPKPASFPRRVLVIGSNDPDKGFLDLAAALGRSSLEGVEFDFTDQPPSDWPELSVATRFIGRHDDFSSLVRRYDLAIHPSRRETFGMAAVETIFAGVPLLSSKTGVIDQLLPESMLFRPNDPVDLSRALTEVEQGWMSLRLDVSGWQDEIAARFSIDETARRFVAATDDALA